MHEGHRKRMLEKLKKEALAPHEMLEVLLFNALPRKNTNDLAHRLLAEFGNLQNLFDAPYERLVSVPGVGESIAAYIACIGYFCRDYYAQTPPRKSYRGIYEPKRFRSYVTERYADEKKEVFDLYLLDGAGRVTARKRFSDAETHNVELQPEAITQAILTHKPSGLVIVHNHPCGKAEASEKDRATTEKHQTLCSFHNVLLCDHLICAKDGLFSFYESGELQEISRLFSMKKLFEREEEAEE